MAENYEELKASALEYINALDQHPPNFKLRRRKLGVLRHLVGAPADPDDKAPTGRAK